MKKSNSNFGKFLLLWSGELISSVGGGLTSFGLGVYVFNETGSAASMAVVSLLAFLPTLLLSVPAGVLADRYDRRLLMMLGDGLSGLGILYILFCMLTGGASLMQIFIGVCVSAVFSSLLEPSYRATVTDLLTKEEYSKASGMVSLAGSARYLISPLIAGILLASFDIKLLLIIDIGTFAVTVITTAIVRKGITAKTANAGGSLISNFKDGWAAITEKKGVLVLILVSAVMTCFMGTFQILAEPMILDFTDAETLGIAETICASGMLFSSLYLGARGIRTGYVKTLSISLALAGIAMSLFGLKENIVYICVFGFLFFALLPFANNCLDYLSRTNIPDEKQGRAWGFIGFLSQIGYVVAYSVSGILADKLAAGMHISVGRGAAAVVMASGIMLAITALVIWLSKEVKALETSSENPSSEITGGGNE